MATLKDIQDRKVTLHGWRKSPTLRVRRRGDNHICLIDLKQFDPVLHEKIEKDTVPKVRTSEEREAEVKAAAERAATRDEDALAESLTRADLATMTDAALRMLPQWKRIPANERNKATTKEAMLELIEKKVV